jgi:hypothetical protein
MISNSLIGIPSIGLPRDLQQPFQNQIIHDGHRAVNPRLDQRRIPAGEQHPRRGVLAQLKQLPRVQAEVAKIFAMPDVRQKVEELGALPGGGSSAELDAFSRAELRKWAKVIKDGNIKPD